MRVIFTALLLTFAVSFSFFELSSASTKSPSLLRRQAEESQCESPRIKRSRSRPIPRQFEFLESPGESQYTEYSESRSSSEIPKGSRGAVYSVQISHPAHPALSETKRKVASAPLGQPEQSESIPSYKYFGSPGRPIFFNDDIEQPPSPPLRSDTPPGEAVSSSANPPHYLFDLNKTPR